LIWLPATTLLSAACLYRAHARRRRRLKGTPPPRPKRRRRAGYRTKVGVAAGAILLLLITLPFVPAVAGVGSSSVRYSYQPKLTRETTGQFLRTPSGTIKLFSWGDPQDAYPRDALRLHSGQVGSLLVRAAAVDRPAAYQLFDVTRGTRVPLAVAARSARTLSLVPTHRLRPGHYVFVGAHEGMFGGKDFAYVRIVPPDAPTTAISTDTRGRAPAVAGSVLPVAAALVALLFTVLLLRSFRSRPAGQKALWASGFACFAVATACEAAAQRAGWTPGLFRAYYLAGGCSTVALLGAGSAWLLLPRHRRLVLVLLAAGILGAAVAVMLAPVDAQMLAATASGRPPANSALGGNAYVWAIALNSLGTLFLVGGSLWSILRRQRVPQNVWIAAGALAVAAATGMSRAGGYSLVYLGELIGIALMFAGFTLAGHTPAHATAQRRGQLEEVFVP
jgi:hypothetical protein